MTQSLRRLAWFQPSLDGDLSVDDTAALIAELGRTYHVDRFDNRNSHDFVWAHGRDAYDLCVYELADTRRHADVWAYVFQYPGLLRLRSATLHHGRAFALARNHRDADFRREVEFGGADLLRAPLAASRLVVVSDDLLAARLRREHAGAVIRCVPLGLGAPCGHDCDFCGRGNALQAGVTRPAPPQADTRPLRLGVMSHSRLSVIQQALERARAAGANAELVTGPPAAEVVREADVVLALEWPPSTGDPPAAALAAMAGARAVVVFETAGTARWSALDPQTWRSRDLAGGRPPLIVSVDPRDEEHSLTLAIRRLASDELLIRRLGDAGHAWWRNHGTAAHAVAGWQDALAEALSIPARHCGDGWPAHLAVDGTGRARQILQDFRLSVDFLA